MKNTLMGSAAVIAVLAGACDAQAGGLYVSLYGGANSGSDVAKRSGSHGVITASRVTTITGSFTRTLTFNFTANSNFAMTGAKAETGWVLGGAIGMDFASWVSGLRGEVELSFRHNGFRSAGLVANAADTDTDTESFGTSAFVVHDPSIRPLAPLVVFNPAQAVVRSTTTFQADFSTLVNNQSSGSSQTWALMANIWYDFDVDEAFKPYVGGGAGIAWNHVQAGGGDVFQGRDEGFAWQLGAGVNIALSGATALNVGYRHLDAGDVEVSVPTLTGAAKFTEKVEHDSVLVGLNVKLE